jgi:hypothetical protein
MARYNKRRRKEELDKAKPAVTPVSKVPDSLEKPLASKINLDSPDKVKNPDKVEIPQQVSKNPTLKRLAAIAEREPPIPKDLQWTPTQVDLPKEGSRGPIYIRPCDFNLSYQGIGQNVMGTPWNYHFANGMINSPTIPLPGVPSYMQHNLNMAAGTIQYHPRNRFGHPFMKMFVGQALSNITGSVGLVGNIPPTLEIPFHMLVEGWKDNNEMILKTPEVGDVIYFNLNQTFCEPLGVQYGSPAAAALSPSMFDDPLTMLPPFYGINLTWEDFLIDNAVLTQPNYQWTWNPSTNSYQYVNVNQTDLGELFRVFFDWCYDGRWPDLTSSGQPTTCGLPPNSHSPPIPWEIINIGSDVSYMTDNPTNVTYVMDPITGEPIIDPATGNWMISHFVPGHYDYTIIANSTNKIQKEYLGAFDMSANTWGHPTYGAAGKPDWQFCYGPIGGSLGTFVPGGHWSFLGGTRPWWMSPPHWL